MKHVSTHTSSEVKATEIMVDDWIEIGGILTRVTSVYETKDDLVSVLVIMNHNDDSLDHILLKFNAGWIIEIYNQTYPK